MDNSIKVDTDLAVKRLSSGGVLAYVGLLTYFSFLVTTVTEMEYVPVTTEILIYYLGGEYPYNKRDRHTVAEGLEELRDLSYIDYDRERGQGYFIPKGVVRRLLSPERYTAVYVDEVQTIVSSPYRGKGALLKHFISLLSTFRNGFGTMSLEYLTKLTGTNGGAVRRANYILKKLKVICIASGNNKYKKNNRGQVHHPRNTYARYEDAELIGIILDENGEILDV